MKDKLRNPFVTIGDIPEPYFCDRKKETERVIRTLTNEGNIVLMSPRRLGKSRLVKHVFKQPRIAEYYQTFYVDLHRIHQETRHRLHKFHAVCSKETDRDGTSYRNGKRL